MDECSGGSEWEDVPFTTYGECLTAALDVLAHPEKHEDPEGTVVPGGMVDCDGEHDWWSSSELRLERGIYVSDPDHQSFSPSAPHSQRVPLPLEAGDDGSAYGYPEVVIRQDRWTLACHTKGDDYYQSHGWHDSIRDGLFQLHARQRSEQNSDVQWWLVSAHAPGKRGMGNPASALVEGPLCIRGDASQYESSRLGVQELMRRHPQWF